MCKTKILPLLLLMLLFVLTFPVKAAGQQLEMELTPEEEQLLWESSGAEELENLVPDQAREILRESGLSQMDSAAVLEMDGKGFLKGIFDSLWDKIWEPVRMFASMTAVVLLAALMGSMSQGLQDRSLSGIYQLISVLCISGMVVGPLMDAIRHTSGLIQQVSQFLLGFVPVYAGIISVSGKPLSAFTCHSMLMGMVELMSGASQAILIPLTGVYLAVCLTGAASGGMEAGGVARTVKSIATWILGLLMTLFVGLLTIKSFVSGAADTVSLRAGKYLAGSFLPMIGGAVGDALGVVQSSVGVIRSTVGVFGILAVAACFLPGILQLALLGLAVKAAQGIGSMLGTSQVSSVLEAAGFVLSFLQTVMILYGLMVIISVSLMLVIGGDGA